jgi:hypothetical protein
VPLLAALNCNSALLTGIDSIVYTAKAWPLKDAYKKENTLPYLNQYDTWSLIKWFSREESSHFKLLTENLKIIAPKDAPKYFGVEEYLEFLKVRSEEITIKRLIDENGKPLLSGQHNSKHAIFVITTEGELLIHTEPKLGEIHHSSLAGGKPVLAAGEMEIIDGEITLINNHSGHYAPDSSTLEAVVLPILKTQGIFSLYSLNRMKVKTIGLIKELHFPRVTQAPIPVTTPADYFFLLGR